MPQAIYSPAAEESLLGSILIAPGAIQEVTTEATDFYLDKNRWIFEAMQDLHTHGRGIDFITLCARLDERGHLADVGGPAYITSLLSATPTSVHMLDYGEVVKERAQRRHLMEIANWIATQVANDDQEPGDIVSGSVERLFHVAASPNGAQRIGTFAARLLDEVEAAYKNPSSTYGIPTGIADYDLLTGGMVRGEVVKLIGDPGVGKSLLGMQMACGMARTSPGAIYSLEMGGIALIRRDVAQRSKIDSRKLRTGKLEEDQWSAFVEAIDVVSQLPIYLSDSSFWTTSALRVDLERLINRNGIQWMLLDYEGLLADNPEMDDIARSKVISSRLHGIVKDLNIAALVIDDMNKAGVSNASAGKANLSGSSRKIFDADAIWVIHDLDEKKPGFVRVVNDKMREGEAHRSFELRRTKGFPGFENIARLQ